jgi:hypothetical protein
MEQNIFLDPAYTLVFEAEGILSIQALKTDASPHHDSKKCD